MNDKEKKRIPLKEGFWTEPSSPEEKPRLIGSKCGVCGDLFFPKKDKGWCLYCQKKSLKDIPLSGEGKICSFSVVMQPPAGGFYKGPVPYAFGLVELTEGLEIVTLFSVDDFSELEVAREVELVIEKLCDDDEGNEVLTFKFRPVKN